MAVAARGPVARKVETPEALPLPPVGLAPYTDTGLTRPRPLLDGHTTFMYKAFWVAGQPSRLVTAPAPVETPKTAGFLRGLSFLGVASRRGPSVLGNALAMGPVSVARLAT